MKSGTVYKLWKTWL